MKVLITGGTGFMGENLVKRLLDNGYSCRCLVRKTSNIKSLKKLDLEIICGDIIDKDSLIKALDRINIVYHLAGKVGEWGILDSEFHRINIDGTENILRASLNAEIDHFIFCSTPGVLGLSGSSKAAESLPYNPCHIYEKTKCEAEKLTLRYYRDKGLPVTVIRPDFVYGPGDLRRVKLYRAIKNNKFFIVGNGNSFLHPTYIDDVTYGFELVMNNSKAFGEVYNIAGIGPITVNEYIRTIAQVLNARIPMFKVPKVLARGAAFFLEGVSKIFREEPFISNSKINFLTISHGSDISKATNQLGYYPETDFRNGIEKTINWCKKQYLL